MITSVRRPKQMWPCVQQLSWISFLCFSVFTTTAQQANTIQALAKSKADGIWLRWAPANTTLWQLGNKYGYVVERVTISDDGNIDPQSKVMITQAPVKPLLQPEMEKLSQTSDEVAALQELIYHEEFNKDIPNNFNAILKKNNELENRMGMALLMCDLSMQAAEAGGLFLNDPTVSKGKRYAYRVKLNYTSSSFRAEPGIAMITYEDEQPLKNITDLNVNFENKKATLSWQTLLNKNIYSAYFIERSTDGKNFSRLTNIPYIHMSEHAIDEMAYYVDSLENNQQTYYYRINGISPFAETGPASIMVSGKGKEDLTGVLIIQKAEVAENSITISWEFPHELENEIDGFFVCRSINPDIAFTDLNKKKITRSNREYKDQSTLYNAYYAVRALDKQGNEVARSFPYHVHQEDNTPPSIPLQLTGKISQEGIVTLQWQPNADKDILGYRVFRSNSLIEESIEVTTEIIPVPLFTDTININVLNKKIYYSVVAVDKNFNNSEYTKPITFNRPDVISPASPVFTKVEMTTTGITLEWTNSISNDISRYVLVRKTTETDSVFIVSEWRTPDVKSKITDEPLVMGYTYYYQLIAYDSSNNKSEATSRQLFFETGIRKEVSDLKAAADRNNKAINLVWSSEWLPARCLIYRKVNDGTYRIYKTIEGGANSFNDTNVFISNNYFYKVQLIIKNNIKTNLSKEVEVKF